MQNDVFKSRVALASIISTALASRLALRASGHALQERQFLCPVVCDNIWCCQIGQTCQEAGSGDGPYECADPLLETTESAFALVPLSKEIDSILSDNNALISSLAEEFSMTLTFATLTSLPGTFEEPTASSRPAVTEPSKPPTTTPALVPSTETPTARITTGESKETTVSSVTTTSVNAAPTSHSRWQHGIAVIGLAMAAVV